MKLNQLYCKKAAPATLLCGPIKEAQLSVYTFLPDFTTRHEPAPPPLVQLNRRTNMKLTPTKLAASMAIATLCAAGLFAQAKLTPHHAQRDHRFGREMAALNLTDAQKAQAKAAFEQARQSAQPIRKQLM